MPCHTPSITFNDLVYPRKLSIEALLLDTLDCVYFHMCKTEIKKLAGFFEN
jgi:hypothetical protein